MIPDLAIALLNSDAFQRNFKVSDGHGNTCAVDFPSRVVSVTLENLRARQTTLEMFDRLVDSDPDSLMSRYGGPSIVRENGAVSHMMDEYLPHNVTVSDQLRGVFMLGEEAETYNVFSDDDRNEFLYHVMWRLVSGNGMNQYEDSFEPYKDACQIGRAHV